jgi:hypothetical protein
MEKIKTLSKKQLHLDHSTPEAAFSLRIDPHTRKGPMHVDSRQFTCATSTTSEGAARNSKQFWKLWNEKYPGTLSLENLKLMNNKSHSLSPIVDEQWIRHFPEHQRFLGQTLEHHHIDHENLVTALPKELHARKPGRHIFHQNLGGEQSK